MTKVKTRFGRLRSTDRLSGRGPRVHRGRAATAPTWTSQARVPKPPARTSGYMSGRPVASASAASAANSAEASADDRRRSVRPQGGATHAGWHLSREHFESMYMYITAVLDRETR